MDGKILLDSKSRFATAPDGNGGLYRALRDPLNPSTSTKETVISSLESRGIKYLHCYGVDNCLVRVGDPIFLGACIKQGVQVGVKVVKKTDPSESVGVVALRNGKFTVIEYSELPKELAEAKDKENSSELAFRAANIANHFYTTSFLAKDVPSFENNMAFHVARKKIPTVDLTTGEPVKPSKPNGMKLELFVFDVFPFVGKKLTVHEVPRKEEFSPLKNAPGTGSDDPETSRRDLLAQQKRWLEAAGASVKDGVEVEISPLVSYAGEGLDSLKGKEFAESTIINELR
jgi:UDP-N-acetylglucosamine/UDP-N-acetylgalactosamine diphosphorylase